MNALPLQQRLQDAERACLSGGARLTELRRRVLELILAADGPVTAYQLLDRLRATHGNAAPPTVYRALDFLTEHHLVHRIERLAAFVPCQEGTPHLHPAQFLICRHCGTVAELEDDGVMAALEKASRRAGFEPQSAVVELEGLCTACR